MDENKNQTTNKVNQTLNLTFTDDNAIWLTSSKTLRKLVGVLGMLLPILLCAFLGLISQHYEVLDSISHYYFTRSNVIFIIIVSLMAVFLMIYKGKEPIDFYLSSIAGIAAFLLLLFPTESILSECGGLCDSFSISFVVENSVRTVFHYVCAGVFLGSLAYMSLFLFTKFNKAEGKTKEKKQRNVVFIICGILMIIALLVVFLGDGLNLIPEDVYNGYHITFWMETLAVEAFGFSWLVKGETILKDS
ncbi:hypothetical protein ACFSKN_12310 [Mariniflexile gromovii]|uniref:DUF998 domain-containing protein n=1 Tax=Mariniflexile gromovii TaxID=362523 RepID=A0ABS4BV18_9FLAO|nr:hypothetical protein [Mariniflexile gromovii]MBP0904429.1 hypothetical protein [Mariniflexile gromovii]